MAELEKLCLHTFVGAHRVCALVYFPAARFDLISSFRDALRDEFATQTELVYRIDDDGPFDIDVQIRYFHAEDSETLNDFYSKPWPGVLAWLFRTRNYREYDTERREAERRVKIELSTSHDGPGYFRVDTSIHTEESLGRIVESVARDMRLEMDRLPPLDDESLDQRLKNRL